MYTLKNKFKKVPSLSLDPWLEGTSKCILCQIKPAKAFILCSSKIRVNSQSVLFSNILFSLQGSIVLGGYYIKCVYISFVIWPTHPTDFTPCTYLNITHTSWSPFTYCLYCCQINVPASRPWRQKQQFLPNNLPSSDNRKQPYCTHTHTHTHGNIIIIRITYCLHKIENSGRYWSLL